MAPRLSLDNSDTRMQPSWLLVGLLLLALVGLSLDTEPVTTSIQMAAEQDALLP